MAPDVGQTLLDRGWVAVDLPDPSPIVDVRAHLLDALQKRLPGLPRLEDYHATVADDQHIAIVHDVSQAFWSSCLSHRIITANLDFFQRLAGGDLHVQTYPYLRVVRPGQRNDAVPLHRDTYYGASPFELSVVVPFTDMDADCALRAIPGSHVEPDTAYPFTQTVSADVEFGSTRHKLGYAYAPRLLDPALEARAEPMPVQVGQVLMFGLSLVHGCGYNGSRRTRFSTDIRIVNSLAPVNFSRGIHADYYTPLCSSAVSLYAQRFLAQNTSGAPKAAGWCP